MTPPAPRRPPGEDVLDTGTLVVGASAAGLATAAQLRVRGEAVELVEAEETVGAVWRRHYDRLHLHTPRSISALPGLPMALAGRYASREEFVRYLESYRERFELRPHLEERAERIERSDGAWTTVTARRTWRSRSVVVATGRTRVPVRPSWPGMAQFGGEVLHSSEYRNGERFERRAVLVVGFGNSACEQALDLAEHGAYPHLCVRSAVNALPRDVLGLVPVLYLAIALQALPARLVDVLTRPLVRASLGDLTALGLHRLAYGPATQIARDRRVPLLDVGTIAAIRAGRIALHGALEAFTGDSVVFADGTALRVEAVVLATGYRPGIEEILPEWAAVCDPTGEPLHSGGPSGLAGLYFCGMRVAPTGMLREIGHEARRIAADIAAGSATARDVAAAR